MEIEDYNKYYTQGSGHYLIPKDVFIELFNEMINWKEESNMISKQDCEIRQLHKLIDEVKDLLIIKKARCLNEDYYVLNVSDLDDILHTLKEVK